MDNAKIIAVDFDGTLVENKWPEIGAPIEKNIAKVKAEQEAGTKIILWTNRVGEPLEKALAFCEAQGIHLDAVNKNLPEIIKAFGTDCRKIFANEYWDDRAVLMSEKDIGEFSDGFHTFNSLYHQRLILFAALVNTFPTLAWKSHKHSDGEAPFGGGWFIVGIDTPKGPYTYHYEDKDWDLFHCKEVATAPEWDGHTDKDVERVLSLSDNESDWAAREVALASQKERESAEDKDDWDYGVTCYESALRAYRSLERDGHSGMSIQITKSILNRLIDGKCLTPFDVPKRNDAIIPAALAKAFLNFTFGAPRASLGVKQVIFSGPKTIVFWLDGTKTIVSCGEGDHNDPYAGFCAAVTKRVFGSTSQAKKVLARTRKETSK